MIQRIRRAPRSYQQTTPCPPHALFGSDTGALGSAASVAVSDLTAARTGAPRLLRGEGRGVSGYYGGRDAACPVTTGGGTRHVRLLRGERAAGRHRPAGGQQPARRGAATALRSQQL